MDQRSTDLPPLSSAPPQPQPQPQPQASGPWDGPEPSGPPRLQRPPGGLPDANKAPVRGPGSGPAPLTPPTLDDEPEPEPQPLIVTTPGWGWRTLAAFVTGGLLTAAGFGVGLRLGGDAEGGETDASTDVTLNPIPEVTVAPQVAQTLAPDETQEVAQVVADLLGPSVVQIETGPGVGSGVIYDDGLILTNHHVIAGFDTVDVILGDGRVLNGEVVGSEPNVDIAVITVGEGLGLPAAELALDDKPQVGETAIAIGSPFRLQQTVTQGIVSAVDRPIRSGQTYVAMIQTDAPINPGNSGGALSDRFGRVIGINTAIQTQNFDNTNSGVGFAVPISTAVGIAERLVAGEPIVGGFLGVGGGPPADGSAGVEITSITPGSAAEEAGLEVGDRILSLDGAPVILLEELAGLVMARRPGDVIVLEIARGTDTFSVEVTLGDV